MAASPLLRMRPRWAVGAALALLAVWAGGVVGLGDKDDVRSAIDTIVHRYGRTPATETVLLEEGPSCVPDVEHIVGVLPSSCCGDMRCPLSGGICCKGNTHCCGNGYICIQGDPGTPPGCLDMMHKQLPVAVHKILMRHHLTLKAVVPKPPKKTGVLPGVNPSSGRVNYEDAFSPSRGGFGRAPASPANTNAKQKGVKEWEAPEDERGVGGGVYDGKQNPLGLKAYGSDSVVMLPDRPDLQKETDRQIANANDDINHVRAKMELEGTPMTDDIINVKTLKAPTRLGTWDEVLGKDTSGDLSWMRFREKGAQGDDSDSPRGQEVEEVEEVPGGPAAATQGPEKAFDAGMLRRLFPPDPPAANRDPPRPPNKEEVTLARLQKQLARVETMRADLQNELRDARIQADQESERP